MAEAKPKLQDARVFDVAKPAKAEASDSKAPLITKRTIVTEPTKQSDDTPAVDVKPAASAPKAAPSATKLKIAPISNMEDLKPEADKPAEDTPKAEEEVEQDENGRDLVKDLDTDAQELQDKKAAERQANFNKLVEAKTYFLPINQVVRRRSKQVVVIGGVLSILLGIAWLGVALDAGLITIPGVKAPTHFFSE